MGISPREVEQKRGTNIPLANCDVVKQVQFLLTFSG